MREHPLIWRDPEEFPRLWNGKLIGRERLWREEWSRKYSNHSLTLSPLSLLKYAWPNGLIIGSQEAQKYPAPSFGVVWILVLVSYGADVSTWEEDEGKRKSLGGECCQSLRGSFPSCIVPFWFSLFWLFLFHTQAHIHSSICFHSSDTISHYSLLLHACHIGQSSVMMS